MASGQSDCERGEGDVVAHKKTFSGFMNWIVYGGALVALIVIYPPFAILFTVFLLGIPACEHRNMEQGRDN